MWTYNQNELYHHGIKGMKWGVRRYQNKDGTLTKAGKRKRARDEYNRDLDEAITIAESVGDPRSYWMSVTRNSRKNYRNQMIIGGVSGLALSAISLSPQRSSGKDIALSLIGGTIGGVAAGAVSAATRVGRGRLIAENDYGVNGMHER